MAQLQPVAQVLLRIEQALQDSILTDSGLKLYVSPDYNKEWKVAVVGTVEALPVNIKKSETSTLAQLYQGDIVCFSYAVVADFEFKGDGGQFMPSTEDDPYVKEFINGKGETVRVYGLAKRSGFKGLTWVGTYQNKRRELIDGIQGTEEQIEKWLSQFPLGKTDIYSFNNLFSYKGKDYWKCYPSEIFAKKVKGHWVAIGDRILCKPVEEDAPAELLKSLQHYESVKIRHQDRAMIVSGGKKLGLKKGNIISFDPKKLEKYTIENKQYYLINERLVNGKWN